MNTVRPSQFWDYCERIYKALTPEERRVLCDGCGAKDIFVKEEGPFYVRWILHTIEAIGAFLSFPPKYCALFEYNCFIHDIGYIVGGTVEHYNQCNRGFFRANKSLVVGDWRGRAWATLGYWAVHKAGRNYFDFLPEPRTLEQVKLIAQGRIEERRTEGE